MRVGLLGDFDASVIAHQAIPRALALAAVELSLEVEPVWIHSSRAGGVEVVRMDALWCVPNSPYADPDAIIDAIRVARETGQPFLGTCGGYQHAVLEFARNRLGLSQAQSSEENPATSMPLINALSCRLASERDAINLEPGSRAGEIYRQRRIVEEYNCGFGVNPEYLSHFVESELKFSGFDDAGGPRIAEIPLHRFFIATAFQPERSAFAGRAHPLVLALLQASA